MAGSLLLPAAPPSSSSFSSPSRPSHARLEHWRRCPVCKTVCAVESAVLIYVNRHTARCCGGRGRQGWGGRTAAAADAEMIPILFGDATAMGRGGRRWRAATRALPPPTSTAATTAAAVAAERCARCCRHWRRRRRGDNAMVTTATTAMATATTACTVTAASTATAVTATAVTATAPSH
jgi:hypothetical protein